MKMLAKLRLFKPGPAANFLIVLAIVNLLGACSTTRVNLQPGQAAEEVRINQLARDIKRLSPQVDPAEAERAAFVAINYSLQLAKQYEINHSALTHNFLINIGVKERGLCIHWTEDLQKRLLEENFRSLEFQWAVANYENPLRLEHSSVVVTVPGGNLQGGLLLDPWRYAGKLYWNQTRLDEDYQWQPREVVRQKKIAHRERLVPQQTTR